MNVSTLLVGFLVPILVQAISRVSPKPTYVIHADKVIHPGQNFTALVTLLQSSTQYGAEFSPTISVRLTIKNEQETIVTEQRECPKGLTTSFQVQVPASLTYYGYHHRDGLLVVEGADYGQNFGDLFKHQAEVKIVPPSQKTIEIATSKDSYQVEEEVRLRCLVLDSRMTPWEGFVTISLLNPEGNQVQRWPRKRLQFGVCEVSFRLESSSRPGNWTVVADSDFVTATTSFSVEECRAGTFEVALELDRAFTKTDDIEGTVKVWHTKTKAGIGGQLFISGEVDQTILYSPKTPIKCLDAVHRLMEEEGTDKWSMHDKIAAKGLFAFRLSIPHLCASGSWSEVCSVCSDVPLLIKAVVTSDQNGESVSNTKAVTIFGRTVDLGMTLPTTAISKHFTYEIGIFARPLTGQSLRMSTLEDSELSITYSMLCKEGTVVEDKALEAVYKGFNGRSHRWRVRLNIQHDEAQNMSNDCQRMRMTAKMIIAGHHQPTVEETTVELPVQMSDADDALMLEISSKDIEIGDNIIFHSRSSSSIEELHFLLVSGSRILSHRHLSPVQSRLLTFHVPATEEMFPGARAIIWTTTAKGKMLWAVCDISVARRVDSGELLVTEVSDNYLTVRPRKQRDEDVILLPGFWSAGEPLGQRQRLNLDFIRFTDARVKQLVFVESPKGSHPISSQRPYSSHEPDFESVILRNATKVMFNGELKPNTRISFTGIARTGIAMSSSVRVPTLQGLQLRAFLPEFSRVNEHVMLQIITQSHLLEDRDLTLVIRKTKMYSFLDRQGQETQEEEREIYSWMPAKGSKNVYVPLKVKEVGDLVVIIKCGDSFINATTKIIERESVISNSTVINMEGRNYIRKELMLALTSVEGKENTVVSVFKRRPVPLFFEDQWEEEAANEVTGLSAALLIRGLLLRRRHSNGVGSIPTQGTSATLKRLLRVVIAHTRKDGAVCFSARSRYPSLWLTSSVLRSLVLFPAVDHRLLNRSLTWLLAHQSATDGSFQESYLFGGRRDGHVPVEFQKVSLTAHIVLSLEEFVGRRMYQSVDCSRAVRQACAYLSSQLPSLHHLSTTSSSHSSSESALRLSLVVRALQVGSRLKLAPANAAETAFEILARQQLEKGEFVFWGDGGCDPLSLRATALALLVYLDRGERISTDRVASWVSEKSFAAAAAAPNEGLCAIVDAWEALLDWDRRKGGEEAATAPTTVRILCGDSVERELHPTQRGNSFVVSRSCRRKSLTVEATGSGGRSGAIVLVRRATHKRGGTGYASNATSTSPLKLAANLVAMDNNALNLTVCISWRCKSEAERISGPVLTEFDIPSGYQIDRNYLNGLWRGGREVITRTGNAAVLFPTISKDASCLEIVLRFSHPVFGIQEPLLITTHDVFSPDVRGEISVGIPLKTSKDWPELETTSGCISSSFRSGKMLLIALCLAHYLTRD